ncbi:TPA: hypothetical protein ACGO1T_000903 [Streptococcus suis]
MTKVEKVKNILIQINETLDMYPEAEWTMGYLNEVITKLPKLSEANALDWVICLLEMASKIAYDNPTFSEERAFGLSIIHIIENTTIGVGVA